jgi:hypothetical protein
MKKLSYIFFVLFSLSFVACSSDDNSSGGEDDNLYIKFTLNGQQYNFEPETITSLQRLIMGDEDVNDVYTRISLWMPVTSTTGSHVITDDTPTDENLDILYNAELWVGDATYTATSGTLVITELNDDYVKGTFSFTGEDENGVTISVTNGSFRAYR